MNYSRREILLSHKMKKISILLATVFSWSLLSCSDDFPNEADSAIEGQPAFPATTISADSALAGFAKILSTAVSQRKDVREFLKSEALKKFDKNYDVLYVAVKDAKVGDRTFGEVLSDFSVDGQLEEIEKTVPALNVYLTRTAFLHIYPENLDVDDAYTPVAVEAKDSVNFYCDGMREFSLPKGEVPGFHVFVVGENSRVIVDNSTNKSLTAKPYRFVDDAFDGTKEEVSNLKSMTVPSSKVGQRALDAYKYFYSNDGSIHQMGLQRDYIYYGLTPNKTQGSYVKQASEYIGSIKVPISTMYKISDQRTSGDEYADPFVMQDGKIEKRGSGYSYADLVNIVWAKGAFDFQFEVITSTQSTASVSYVPLTPDQLWTISYTYSKKHKTWFHRTRHTYVINVNDFKAKDVIFDSPIDMGKWNIAEEALYRTVKVMEYDKGKEMTKSVTYSNEKMKSKNFKGNYKLSLGFTVKVVNVNTSADISNEKASQNTDKISTTVTEKWIETSDDLGQVRIYYYDPVIEGMNGSSPIVKTYNTGSVEFGVFVK